MFFFWPSRREKHNDEIRFTFWQLHKIDNFGRQRSDSLIVSGHHRIRGPKYAQTTQGLRRVCVTTHDVENKHNPARGETGSSTDERLFANHDKSFPVEKRNMILYPW